MTERISIDPDDRMWAYYRGIAAGARASDELAAVAPEPPFTQRSSYFWLKVGIELAQKIPEATEDQMILFVQGAGLHQPETDAGSPTPESIHTKELHDRNDAALMEDLPSPFDPISATLTSTPFAARNHGPNAELAAFTYFTYFTYFTSLSEASTYTNGGELFTLDRDTGTWSSSNPPPDQALPGAPGTTPNV